MPQTTRKFVLCLLVYVTVLMFSAASALAQGANTDSYPKFEFFAGYSAHGEANARGISFGTASINANYNANGGFEASLIRNFNKHIGIKGDFSAHFDNSSGRGLVTSCTPTCTSASQDVQLKTRVYNFLAGPEFKARNRTRFTPFAYALAGTAYTRATFRTPGPTLNLLLKRWDTGFAMALGGGLDIRATKRVSFRGSMDYNPVWVNDSIDSRRDLVRLSLGVLFH
ncbi:MAG TPA: outer membrane beta-barrel protein [Pyrinomonadaceae bacterium]